MIGQRFGSYEVVAQLGEGGMGAVYRARDTKLNRDVALKVLLPEVAHDPERLARFRREAQTLAALNHPNVASIHGLEESGATPALVMEVVEGPTLAERISRGPIGLDEALPVAKQIADALEAAHEQGIVHRDLKPANIKVRNDGTVKVLDFGLAKALEGTTPSGGSPDILNSPTITSPVAMTGVGIILGTAAYMAPEQARGRAVDKRADIWAFGCVLYEMTTGRRLFDGEDLTDVLASIVKVDADVSLAPVEVRRLLRKCLEKDPKKRLRDIADWALLVDDTAATPTAARTAPARSRLWPIVAATSTFAAIAAIVAALWLAAREPSPPPPTVVRVVVPAGLEIVSSSQLAVSPDGNRLVFSARRGNNPAATWQLYVWSRDSLEARPIPGTEGVRSPSWSPDGRSVAFRMGGAIRRVDVAGGVTDVVVGSGAPVDGIAWSGDGVILFANAAGGISRVPAAGGEPVAVTVANTRDDIHQEAPVFLPDGRHFLYARHALDREATGIYLGSIDAAPADQPAAPLLLADDGPKFVTGTDGRIGHVLFQRRGTLFAQAFDVQALQLRGEPIAVATGVAGGDVDNYTTASANGDLIAYRPRTALSQAMRRLVWVDRKGQQEPLPLAPGGYEDPMVSPDGKRIALAVEVRGGEARDIWIWDVARQNLSRLTFDASSEIAPLWTRDGARIVYSQQNPGGLFSKAADGTGTVERVGTAGGAAFGWGADGRLITATPPRSDIGVVEPDGERRVLLGTTFSEGGPAMSPDGRWMAYESDESGQIEIYVRPYPEIEKGKWLISSGGGMRPRWSPTGTEVFFIGPEQMMAVRVDTRAGFMFDRPTPLFAIQPYAILGRPRSYDVSADGKRLLMLMKGDAEGNAERADLVFIQHWRPTQQHQSSR